MPHVEYINSQPFTVHRSPFTETSGFISIEAEQFVRSQGTDRIHWEIIPDLGKTRSGITTFPANAYPQQEDLIYLEYDLVLESAGTFDVEVFLAPTLNFNGNKGLRYALSFDGGREETVNFNGHYRGELGPWQAESIIRNVTTHTIAVAGNHTLRFRVLEPGIVLEKILINTGGLKPSYLGAPSMK
jgi:hypothetical protein